jgi:sugar lactone lactonase YvrE
MRRNLSISAFVLASFLAFGAASASAEVPVCTGDYSQSTLYSDQGRLESVIVGGGGKLFYSGAPAGSPDVARLYRADGPGSTPETVLDAPEGPGGLAWKGKRLLWGNGNTLANGLAGDLNPGASLLSVNPSNGTRSVITDSLGMANGIARKNQNGAIFASNDLGLKLDRVKKKGSAVDVKNGFTSLESANGITVSRGGKYIYAAQTFVTPSTISRIEIANPSNVSTWFTSPLAANVVFDGLARDNEGNFYVAVLGSSEVWKINHQRQACVLASGLTNTSSVAISTAGKRFSAGNLYAVEFGGKVTEVKGAVEAVVPG